MQCGYCQWARHQMATKANVYGFIHSFEVDLFEILGIQVAPKILYPSFDRSPRASEQCQPASLCICSFWSCATEFMVHVWTKFTLVSQGKFWWGFTECWNKINFPAESERNAGLREARNWLGWSQTEWQLHTDSEIWPQMKEQVKTISNVKRCH